MKTDADVGIEASSAVATSSTLWYGRWHGNVDASGYVDTSSRTNASTGLWMPADAERQQRCNRDQWQGYWFL